MERAQARRRGQIWRAALRALPLALLSAPAAPAQQPAPRAAAHTHRVTVRFDYDFHAHPACPAAPAGKKSPPDRAKRCVQQFRVYNLTDRGARTLLFTIPAPPRARKPVRGITGTSAPLNLAPGEHQIAVTAVWDNGAESNPLASAVMVRVSP